MPTKWAVPSWVAGQGPNQKEKKNSNGLKLND